MGTWSIIDDCFILVIIFAAPTPTVLSLGPSTSGVYTQFTLNCTSSMSAATNVTWWRNGVQLDRSVIYDFVQILREGISSTYDNLLLVYIPNINELAGNYSCTIANTFGRTTRNVSFNGEWFHYYNTCIHQFV